MSEIREKFEQLGVVPADIMMPKKGVDLEKWAVVACDQYTSERDYWESAMDYVGSAPSTLKLIFPECYLEDEDGDERIQRINETMKRYVEEGIFDTYKECFFLVKRTCGSGSRLGLMAALDLDRYSWERGSKTIIRATEGTILSRIPPRKKIRRDAPLEIPHIMVLISDEKKSVIEPLYEKRESLRKIYDTPLMKNGGRVEAYLVDSPEDLEAVYSAFKTLSDGMDPDNPLLFAMGDGNHSFATAKSCWEDIKAGLTEEERKTHPARFCLVELENIFDPGLVFEPIHRVLFGVSEELFLEELKKTAQSVTFESEADGVHCRNCIKKRNADQTVQGFGYCTAEGYVYVRLHNPKATISAGTLQIVIDSLLEKGCTVDYIHGDDVTEKLGREPGNIGLFLPAIPKTTFFESIMRDGALPRKTFSMGEAQEKRYYMESRSIK